MSATPHEVRARALLDRDVVRARSAVEAATSVDVVWDGGGEVVDAVTPLPGGALAWDVPASSELAERLACDLRDPELRDPDLRDPDLRDPDLRGHVRGRDLGVCLAVTDLAPLAVRQRVRGRLALAGRLEVASRAAAGTRSVRLTPQEVVWQEPGRALRRIAQEDYRAAEPDPLAAWEADVLLGLQRQPDLLVPITDLVRRGPGVAPSWWLVPLRLDRSGLVVRAQGPRGSRDVRLRFAHEATTVDLAWGELERLAGA
jgi:hypothetical protein